MTRTQPSEPLADRRLFQTHDLDEARAIVGAKFCDHRLEIHAEAGRFDATHHRAEGQAASLNFIRYGADVTIDPGELGSFYLIQVPLAGQADVDNGGGMVQTQVGVGSVLNPHRPTRMRWHGGCAQLLLQIDAAEVTDQAERMLGHHLSAPVTFDTTVHAGRAATAQWLRKLTACLGLAERRALFGAGAPSNQIMVEHGLIQDFLLSQPSDISDQLIGAAGTAQNVLLRKAARFIGAHLADPLTIASIANAAGVTPRRLQQAFRAELGQSPMGYLRQRRLHLARSLLTQPGEAPSVADVCHRAGFTHQSRFSADYRAQFGERPSDTLHRSRGESDPGL